MSIYINQSYINIQLDTDITLSGATDAKIHYTKPSGSTGYWTGTTSGENIEYEVQPGDLDEAGIWLFQGEVTMSDGRLAKARTVRQKVLPEFA